MILSTARQVIQIEKQALDDVSLRLDSSFESAVRLVMGCAGKVVVCGMGKSGNIGRKIAATLSSTGTPAFFLHPAEALHGDLGMVDEKDIVVAISYSGETDEFSVILPAVKRLGVPLISITGRTDSTLARYSDIVIDVRVEKEACPMGLAPTASTTATLAVGDALAVAVLKEKGFTEEDFARLHPGGSLGRKMLTRVKDLMHTGDEMPIVGEEATLRDAIMEMVEKRFGIVGVLDTCGQLVAAFSNGDLSRVFQKHRTPPLDRPIGEFSTPSPKTISPDALASAALRRMEENKITVLFVMDGELVGLIHLHDILGYGIM